MTSDPSGKNLGESLSLRILRSNRFPIYLLFFGLLIDFTAECLGKAFIIGEMTMRWGTVLAFLIMGSSTILVIYRSLWNRTLMLVLAAGTLLLLTAETVSLLRRVDFLEVYFSQPGPALVNFLIRRIGTIAGVGLCVSGLYAALLQLRGLRDKSIEKSRQLAAQIQAREKAEEDLLQHQENLEETIANRTRDLRHEVEERMAAEAALRESEERFDFAMRGATDGLWDWNFRTDDLFLSPRWKSMLGYEPEELPANFKTWIHLVHPEDFQDLKAYFRRTIQTREPLFEREYRMRHKQGHLVHILSRAFLVYDGEGKLARMVGTHVDITERKKHERELAQEAGRRKLLMDQSNDGIVIMNQECGVYDANRRFAENLGYTLEEVKELHAWDWDACHPREAILEMAHDIRGKVDRFETQHRRKDGSVLDVEIGSNGEFIHGEWLIFCVCRDITERKRIEREIRDREERYRAAIETSGDGFFLTDMRGRILEVNQVYSDMSGYSREELLGRDLALLDAQQNRTEIFQTIETVRQQGSILFESLHRAKDGTAWPVELNIAYWPIEEGRLFVFIRDVLRRKASDALLHARLQLAELSRKVSLDELMQAALDTAETLTASRIGYFHFVEEDQEHLTLQAWSTRTVNEGCKATTGAHYPISEAGVWVDCFHAKKPVIHNDYESLPTKKGLPEGHSPVLREMGVPVVRDNLVVAIMGVGNKSTDYNQEDIHILQNLASLVIDLVERKRAEEALRDSEENLRRAQEVSHTGSFVFDFQIGQFIFSDEACRIFELPFRSRVTFQFLEKELVHPEDVHKIHEARQMSLEAGGFDLQHRLPPSRGEKWVHVRSQYEFDEAGKPRRTIGTIQDITEIKRMQEERIELERRLLHSQKLESLGILAGGIAHDFNNILMAILGNLDLVKQDLPSTSPLIHGVEQAIWATRRATELTQQMLAYSGKGRFISKRFDLSHMVRENANLFRASVARNVNLRVLLTSDPVEIVADPGQVQQVIMNLLTNAVEAIGENPGVVTLSTSLVEEDEESMARNRLAESPPPGNFACLRVTDSGCGMDEVTQERLFDPFFTTKFTGRGLGMSALMGIVQGHHGIIRVDSSQGQGSVIEVCFPLAPRGETGMDPERPTMGEGIRSLSLRALVVDDEEPVRALAARFLERIGVQSIGAENGDKALEYFREHHSEVDFVLVDMTMPQRDGVSTVRAMRELDPGVRVILTTGYSEQEALDRFHGEDVPVFLQKPYQQAEIEEAIHRILPASIP
jgi:PAS domain S-box-containing protein